MRTVEHEDRYEQWFAKFKSKNVVAIEFGAGLAVPTVRVECQKRSKTLIRVNPRDYLASVESISIPLNALEAIQGIGMLGTGRYANQLRSPPLSVE